MATPEANVINELKLVNVDYTCLRPEPEMWGQDKGIIFVKTCSRKTWVGRRDDFRDFPETIGSERKGVYEGAAAYGFLIRLKSGMESNNTISQITLNLICANSAAPMILLTSPVKI